MTTLPAARPRATNPRVLVGGLAASAATLAGLYLVAVCTARGQWWDQAVWWRVQVHSPISSWQAARALGVVSPLSCVAALLAVLLLPLAAGRRRHALVGLVCAAGTFVSAEALKLLLVRPDLGVAGWWGNSFPSGHTGAVAALAVAAVVALGRGSRVLVGGLTALATLATGTAVVVAGWHRPSDPVASTLVAVIWTLVGLLLVRRENMRA